MGIYYWDKKDTVEDFRSVSISFLRKHGYFSEPCSMSGTIIWINCFGCLANIRHKTTAELFQWTSRTISILAGR